MHVSPLFIYQLYEFLSKSEMIILVEKINLPAGRNKAFLLVQRKNMTHFIILYLCIILFNPYTSEQRALSKRQTPIDIDRFRQEIISFLQEKYGEEIFNMRRKCII